MSVSQCPRCGKLLLRAPDPDQPPKPFTPTLNGFERFLRKAVGLRASAPGAGPEVTGRDQDERERR